MKLRSAVQWLSNRDMRDLFLFSPIFSTGNEVHRILAIANANTCRSTAWGLAPGTVYLSYGMLESYYNFV